MTANTPKSWVMRMFLNLALSCIHTCSEHETLPLSLVFTNKMSKLDFTTLLFRTEVLHHTTSKKRFPHSANLVYVHYLPGTRTNDSIERIRDHASVCEAWP